MRRRHVNLRFHKEVAQIESEVGEHEENNSVERPEFGEPVPFVVLDVLVSRCECEFELTPDAHICGLFRRSHEPVNLSHLELPYCVETDKHANQVAPEHVEDELVPPALLEVWEPDFQSGLHQLEGKAHEPGESGVPEDPDLEGPSDEVCNHKNVDVGSDVVEVGVGVFRRENPAVFCVVLFSQRLSEARVIDVVKHELEVLRGEEAPEENVQSIGKGQCLDHSPKEPLEWPLL